MLKRFLLGLMIGAVVGVAAAAALSYGLPAGAFAGAMGPLVAYAAAVATGALTGLVAGKPIWAAGAKTEAGLKAFFGALLAAGGMFALRQWAQAWSLDLSILHAGGPAPVGELPAASLPLIAAVLGGFFELDNSDDGDAAAQKKRVAAPPLASGASGASGGSGARVAAPPGEAEDEGDAPAASRRARR